MKALYVPLEVREQVPSKAVKAQTLGIFDSGKSDEKVKLAQALEMGRIVSRDIGGSDPERMAAPRYTLFIRTFFIPTKLGFLR